MRDPQSAFMVKQQRLAEVAERGRFNLVPNCPTIRQAPHQPQPLSAHPETALVVLDQPSHDHWEISLSQVQGHALKGRLATRFIQAEESTISAEPNLSRVVFR